MALIEIDGLPIKNNDFPIDPTDPTFLQKTTASDALLAASCGRSRSHNARPSFRTAFATSFASPLRRHGDNAGVTALRGKGGDVGWKLPKMRENEGK